MVDDHAARRNCIGDRDFSPLDVAVRFERFGEAMHWKSVMMFACVLDDFSGKSRSREVGSKLRLQETVVFEASSINSDASV